jgi:hypothetical protein
MMLEGEGTSLDPLETLDGSSKLNLLARYPPFSRLRRTPPSAPDRGKKPSREPKLA